MDSREKAILKTLLYFDIFDYPLTKFEIYKFLTESIFTQKELPKILISPNKEIENKDGYFYLKGRKEIVAKRLERKKISLLKIKKANRIIGKITFIPSIKFIGISGALSMNNASIDDDIDIFVIAENNLVWTTRILIIVVLKFFGVYRGKKDKSYSDKICLNMIIEENKISFEKNNGNLYTAHEIVQLIPVFDKDDTYDRFVKSNNWVNNFLPNSRSNTKIAISKKKNLSDKFWISFFNFLLIEKLFKYIQFNFMKRFISKEVIQDGFLGFHPFDYKSFVLNKYIKKLNEYNLIKTRI